MCKIGFLRLLSLGKGRYLTLRRAATKGAAVCPLDGRFVPRALSKTPSPKQQFVFDYLDNLYHTVAEPLPDGYRNNKRPRTCGDRTDEPDLDRTAIRQLPPGSFADYHRMCQVGYTGQGKIGYRLFARVWQTQFRDKLRIRKASQHAKCACCTRHKLIIRKLGQNTRARDRQVILFRRHLSRQYKDRTQYWSLRSLSVLNPGPLGSVCLILDSMDCAKHSFPRSASLNSKDFQCFNRPRMSHTGCILHGHSILSVLSPPAVPSNASRSCEILSHSLTLLAASGRDLRPLAINLQGDNCCKELKNITILRWLSFQVSTHRVRSGTLNFLQSGHSHEDVDMYFSTVNNWYGRHKELHTMKSFQDCLQQFLDLPTTRPKESFRRAIFLEQARDWNPHCIN